MRNSNTKAKGEMFITPSKRAVGAAYSAFGWALTFAIIHFYWGFGGSIGFRSAVGSERLLSNTSFIILGLWGVGILFVFAGLLSVALVKPWVRIIPRWVLFAAIWITGVLFLLRGIIVEIQDILIRAHFISLPAPLNMELIYWRLFLWSPWFMFGGILFCVTGWCSSHSNKKHGRG
ncbi:DUF3995 domain-containing protein [Siminovitchia terrae]|uniref:DUF3995 domain-containing protein n=1 Tax=Siminovitchia terrae TaxID=1914933 RepID=UPI001BB3C631|nr:DUF3995 domain-containing protein [Siminovitchia terrae]